jgi:hypothetical protein
VPVAAQPLARLDPAAAQRPCPCASSGWPGDPPPESCGPTATQAPHPAEGGPKVPIKTGPSALSRRRSQAQNKQSSTRCGADPGVRGSRIDPGSSASGVASREREGDGCAAPAAAARPR